VLIITSITDDGNSLDIAEGLIDLLIQNSLNRERLLRVTVDDLACILGIDIESTKIILNSVRTNYSNRMIQEMTELR
jgi:hypothetical protein